MRTTPPWKFATREGDYRGCLGKVVFPDRRKTDGTRKSFSKVGGERVLTK